MLQMRQTMHRLKIQTGLKDIHQSNSILITDRSLLLFMRMARDHLTDPAIRPTPRPIPNIEAVKDFYATGITHFQSILTEEARKNKGNKFKLGGPLAEITRLTSAAMETEGNEGIL